MESEAEKSSFGACINDPLLVSSIGSNVDTQLAIADIALQYSAIFKYRLRYLLWHPIACLEKDAGKAAKDARWFDGKSAHTSSNVILVPHAAELRENVRGPISTNQVESSTMSFACFMASRPLFCHASTSNSHMPLPSVTCSDTRRLPLAGGILAFQVYAQTISRSRFLRRILVRTERISSLRRAGRQRGISRV